jgi:ATP-dependent DNA helicase RecQ
MKEAEKILQDLYGYSTFRPGQRQIIQSILERKNTLGIMPTGGGKSICYQIPALLFPGVTLVISPLISLMKDQVDALLQLGIPATYINSSLHWSEIENRLHQAEQGKFKLIYIAPERLESERFHKLLSKIRVSMVTVDEAHCISQWGHDFRPSYLQIGPMIRQLSTTPIVAALTATATRLVRQDIIENLGIPESNIFLTGFQRENLRFSVYHQVERLPFLLQYIRNHPHQSGIIYCATRKEVDHVHSFLLEHGIRATKYHAGMSDEERALAQEKFLYDRAEIMVATNAFGMGIDKSNVRFVIHYNMPKNLENYYQEAGRAGRDGEESECILLFQTQDIYIQRYLIEQSELPPERKELELQKLQAMIRYCYSQECLQRYIVHYFDDPSEQTCGKCMNCQKETAKQDGEDITTVAQKIFSCIWRMRERFGYSTIARVLKGSRSQKIKQFGLHRLSTYGILSEYTEKEIIQLCRRLEQMGFLKTDLISQTVPVVKLTAKAIAVLKGEQKVYLPAEQKEASALTSVDPRQELFELLRQLRLQIAEEEQIPPYVVFHDSTLRAMCEAVPTEESALLRIKGMGRIKFEKYGHRFLQVIREFAQKHSLTPLKTEQKEEKDEQKLASHLITYKLYRQGKSIDEIAKERNLQLNTIEDHLLRCDVEGYPVDWDAFIPKEFEAKIEEAIDRIGATRLRPLKDALPEEVTYFMIKAAIARRQQKIATKSH